MSTKNIGLNAVAAKKETIQEKKLSDLLARRKRLLDEAFEEEQQAQADKDPVQAEQSAESLDGVYEALAGQDPTPELSQPLEFAQVGGEIAGAGTGAGGGVGAGATGLGTAGAAGAASAGAGVAAGVAAGTAAVGGVTAGAVAGTTAIVGGAVVATSRSDSPVLPVVLADQAFSYTENRQAGSFIGSVDASGQNGIVDYRFWDPVMQTFGNTSPDGYFRIDSKGRIFLTEAGATSYVNDADDSEQGGPLNSHEYLIGARDPAGIWSLPVVVMLSENNCVCDDPGLAYLIELPDGTTNYDKVELYNAVYGGGDPDPLWAYTGRVLKNGDIYSRAGYFDETLTSLREVQPGKPIIQMISSDSELTVGTIVQLVISLEGSTKNPSDPAVFLDDVACINMQASDEVSLDIDSRQANDGTGSGDSRLADNFMPSLEKIYLSNRVEEELPEAYIQASFDNSGSENWLAGLKDITLLAGGDRAYLRVTNYAEEFVFGLAQTPRDSSRGDNFMSSLETIHVESTGSTEISINNQVGDDFMKALTSLTAIGGGGGNDFSRVEVQFDSLDSDGYALLDGAGSVIDDGYAQGYMEALEVVTAINRASQGNTEILFHNATSTSSGADDYMSNLNLIVIESKRDEKLSFVNGGGMNYMGSLEEISMTHSTRVADFNVVNTSRFNEQTETVRNASDFMSSLHSIDVVSEGRVKFKLINEGERYSLNEDFDNPLYTAPGANFMASLKTIDVQAGVSENVEFEMLVKVQPNDNTLSSMESLAISGGKITALFDVSLESQDWFDFEKIQGAGNQSVENFTARDSWANQLVVIGGFDAGDIDDKIVFDFGPWSEMKVLDIDDITWAAENGDIRINYATELGYTGSIVLLGVADTFVFGDNVQFGWA